MTVLAVQSNTVASRNSKLENLKQRATHRKNRTDLRHTPNEHDISVANENVRVVSFAQNQTINKQR